ncbi:DUF551 domain-containing protein, partial [Citrobacter freundii]
GTFRKGPCGYSPSFHEDAVPLYTAPPAPVSVPDEMEMDDDFDSAFEHGKAVGWNACRAAMLQGAEPVTTAYKLPANTPCKDAPEHIWLQTAGIWPASRTEMGDVLLYRAASPAAVSVPDGVLKSLLPDAEKPEFWFEHNGKIFFEGVKFNNAVFEACRAAMLQGAEPVSNRDELPVWVACSERMPPPKTGVVVGCWFGRNWATKWATYLPYHPDAHQSGFLMPGGSWTPTHWMPLPAAPQQEVTQALAKGMERYGDAMQKLADSGD